MEEGERRGRRKGEKGGGEKGGGEEGILVVQHLKGLFPCTLDFLGKYWCM